MTGRSFRKPSSRGAPGSDEESLQVLLVVLLGLCVLIGWLLIRELTPAPGASSTPVAAVISPTYLPASRAIASR
ncbi:MAG TPA: hypothetical protein VK012_07335 [Gemmatimonadales bacterium]|nr:hypothetical protein [Gemmatimonadales bacterium]